MDTQLLTMLTLSCAALGCATTPPPVDQVPTELAGPVRSERADLGESLFEETCGGARCHTGLGPDLDGLGVTPGQVRAQVRQGPGKMPSFDTSELSDENLEHILAYLGTLGTIRGADR